MSTIQAQGRNNRWIVGGLLAVGACVIICLAAAALLNTLWNNIFSARGLEPASIERIARIKLPPSTHERLGVIRAASRYKLNFSLQAGATFSFVGQVVVVSNPLSPRSKIGIQ